MGPKVRKDFRDAGARGFCANPGSFFQHGLEFGVTVRVLVCVRPTPCRPGPSGRRPDG